MVSVLPVLQGELCPGAASRKPLEHGLVCGNLGKRTNTEIPVSSTIIALEHFDVRYVWSQYERVVNATSSLAWQSNMKLS